MVGEVLQTNADYHIMCSVILSIQNVVLFIKKYKLDIGVKIGTFCEFRLGFETLPENFSWKACLGFDAFETD